MHHPGKCPCSSVAIAWFTDETRHDIAVDNSVIICGAWTLLQLAPFANSFELVMTTGIMTIIRVHCQPASQGT